MVPSSSSAPVASADAPIDADTDREPGRYRRRGAVSLVDGVLVSTRPLAATSLNDAGVEAVGALAEDAFRTPGTVASATGQDRDAVAALFERLHRRGFLEWRPARDPAHRPPVSVVVTVRNDRAGLLACLDALAGLDYPAYEVVVVDDGSTDGTAAAAAGHPLADDGRVRVASVGSDAEPLGIGASRNRGVATARNPVVAFTDADCRPRPDWLADLVPCLAAHDVVGGRVRPAGGGPAAAYEGVNSSLDMGPRGARVDPSGGTPYLPTANLVGRRDVIAAVGFPERDVAEDVELCWRAVDAGFDVVYTPEGVVEHVYRSGLRAFASRRATYGASEALLARDRGRAGADRVDVPVDALAVIVLGLTAVVAGGAGAAAVLWTGVALGGLGFAARLVGLGDRSRRLAGLVSGADVARSWLRERFSVAYALAREVTRYYALPLGAAGLALSVVRPGAGAAVLTVLAAAVSLPPVVEYLVHDPDVAPLGYAAYFLADHLGYGAGLYRGALAHRTVAHLAPASRFRTTLPGVGALGGDEY